MSLILAIEPDQRQAAQLADLIRGRLNADLVHARTTEGALTALAGIGDRVPDLVLVPSLLSAQEDAAIAGALRVIATAANVRMLTIPVLAAPERAPQHRGVFAKLRGRKAHVTPGGCDPAVFADQIAAYLAEAAAERRAREADADVIDPPAAIDPGRPAFAVPLEPAPARAAAPAFEEVLPPTHEPVPEAVIEPTPIRYAPIVIPPLSPPSSGEEPPSIWLTPAAAPRVELEVDGTLRDPFAETELVHEPTAAAVDEPVEPAATDYAPQAFTTIAPPETAGLDDQSQMLAIEELLEVIALDEQAPPDISIAEASPRTDHPPAVIATEPALQGAAIDEGPVVVAIPEAAEDSALAAGPETVVEPALVAPRRRRKNRRASKPESDDSFDVDALLAPLLSELAAKRAAPARRKASDVRPSEDTAPTAAMAPEPISPPPPISVPASVPALPLTSAQSTQSLASESSVDHLPADETSVSYGRVTPAEPPLADDAPMEHWRMKPAPVDATEVDEAWGDAATVEAEPIDTTAVAVAVTSALPVEFMPVGVMSEDVTPADVSTADVAPLAALPIAPTPVEPTPIEPMSIAPMPISPMPAAPAPVAQAPMVDVVAAESEVDPMFFADNVHDGTPDPVAQDRPAWVELIESLRKDIERLKAERPQSAAAASPPPIAPPMAEPQPPRVGRVLSIASARPANQAKVKPASKVHNAAPRAKGPKPIQDQWGLFDPDQCGFAALRAKLDEISSREEVSV